MSKIDGAPSGPGSVGSASKVKSGSDDGTGASDGNGGKEKRADSTEQAAERISNVTLESSPFGEKARPEGKGGSTLR